jgi:hypothetical protein
MREIFRRYHDPELVDDVAYALEPLKGRTSGNWIDTLCEGVQIKWLVGWLLYCYFDSTESVSYILVRLLNSDDFVTYPKIDGPVRAVRLRPVTLFTDSDWILGEDLLVFLRPLDWRAESTGAPRRSEEAKSVEPESKSRVELENEENKNAIEFGAQLLRRDNEITQGDLYRRLFETRKAGDGAQLTWKTAWNPSRFKEKIWVPARVGAGLPEKSPPGRRRNTDETKNEKRAAR